MYNTEFFKKIMKRNQKRKRYIHSLNVADAAVSLAKIYGANEDAAYTAGLLHDICKDMPYSKQRSYALDCPLSMSKEEARSKQLWHAVAGAQYAHDIFNINDPDILAAIRYHTVGRARMSRLEEIVYIADLISAERKYKDAAKVRKLAYSDINAAMLEILRFSIESISKKCACLPISTAEAYNYYLHLCESIREIKESELNG